MIVEHTDRGWTVTLEDLSETIAVTQACEELLRTTPLPEVADPLRELVNTLHDAGALA